MGAEDTYYVVNIKGVGHIYQQTFIDTYSKVAFTNLYDKKNALVTADMLNDQVVPFFDEHKLRLLRVLTDKETEYCGLREHTNISYILLLKILTIPRLKAPPKTEYVKNSIEQY